MFKNILSLLLVFLASVFVLGCHPDGGFLVQPVSTRQTLLETEIQRDEGFFVDDKIAVIEVDGLMVNMAKDGLFRSGENPVSLFIEKLDRARHDGRVKAVVLRINSPGGTVAASDMMHRALLDFRSQTKKPVVACMLDVAASGGYYLACGCDGIIAGPTTITGSIGTIMQTVSFAGTLKKLGIKAEAVKSRRLKDIASPLHDLRDDERAVLKDIITQFYENFLEVVLAGRCGLARDRLLELADGRVFTGNRAHQVGLVDRIGYPKDAIAWAKELAGLGRAKVVMYHRPLGYKANLYASSQANIEPVSLINIELPQWMRSEGPQFLYLWQIGGN